MTGAVDQAETEMRPRLLSRSQAACYCSVSTGTFSNWVRCGKLPLPLSGTRRWDVKAIDVALDTMSGLAPQELSALDEWRSKRARRPERNS
jgi:hypothetical protein